MKSGARSKQRALSDITKKFAVLPAAHPDKPILAKLIVALRAELAVPSTPVQIPDPR
jgi:hypothetical protein